MKYHALFIQKKEICRKLCRLAQSWLVLLPLKRNLHFAADDSFNFCRFFKNNK